METTEQFQKEQWAEEQFERTANGLAEETFAQWKIRKQAMAELFASLKKEA